VSISDIEILKVDMLEGSEEVSNECRGPKLVTRGGTVEAMRYSKFVEPDWGEGVIQKITYTTHDRTVPKAVGFVRAGPRQTLHFAPEKGIRAAVVTCGGLCPGLNNVIREIVDSLHNLYGAELVYGVRGGYMGFTSSEDTPYVLVSSQKEEHQFQSMQNPTVVVNGETKFCEVISVANIHHAGGTVLAAGRGGHDTEAIVNFIKANNLQHLYVVGGDGSQRGALKVANACMELGINCSVAGVPKTIDNDLAEIDRSFGFETAVQAATTAIRAATVEAKCNKPRGIGVVKLMGRSAGFIAAHATLAAGDVDLCLVPEVPLVLDGETGCLEHLKRVVDEKGYAVVVVAEGAGEDILGQNCEVDAGGNRKLPAIGSFIKDQINAFFKKCGTPATVKFIDPSYMIRSVPANAADSQLCTRLSQTAVHGAMAGMTGFISGVVHNRMVCLPMKYVVEQSPCHMNVEGHTWERILCDTLQPIVHVPGSKMPSPTPPSE